VFIVGYLGDGRAAQVLFESTGSAWDSPPSRETGQGVADPITKSFAKHHGCSAGKDSIPRNHIIAQTLQGHAPRYNGDEEALIAFDRTRATVSGDITAPLRHCGAATEGVNDAKADTQCVAFDWQSGGDVRHNCSEHHTSALSSSQTPADCGRWGVRRLTPTECESLQGFPDGWTAGQSDSARYRQLGNAVCVPVAEWIGKRIMETENGHLPNSP
jgi:DNA (cytosine-5)-methyltransferase 1